MPARPPASIDMLQMVMPPFHRQRRDRRPVVLDYVTGRAAGTDLRMIARMMSLG